MSEGAPIELYGLDAERGFILARRAGEPSFVWVQDLGDAYQAAGSRGGVDVVVTKQMRAALIREGYSPWDVQGLKVI